MCGFFFFFFLFFAFRPANERGRRRYKQLKRSGLFFRRARFLFKQITHNSYICCMLVFSKRDKIRISLLALSQEFPFHTYVVVVVDDGHQQRRLSISSNIFKNVLLEVKVVFIISSSSKKNTIYAIFLNVPLPPPTIQSFIRQRFIRTYNRFCGGSSLLPVVKYSCLRRKSLFRYYTITYTAQGITHCAQVYTVYV